MSDDDDFDSLEEYIREKMKEPTEITAEDLSPPVCMYCGKELVEDAQIVVWDIPERDNKETVWRYRYCSEEHKKADMRAPPDERSQYGEAERLTPDEREKLH